MERIINKLQAEIDACKTQIETLNNIKNINAERIDEGTILVQLIQLKARKKAFQSILHLCEAELDFDLNMKK